MPFFLWRRCALLLLVVSAPVQAGPDSAPAFAPAFAPVTAPAFPPTFAPALSPASIAVLVGACESCHGPGGRSASAIPGFAGQPEGLLRARLLSFREATAPDATIMTRLMKGYDEAQIAALAHWFAQEP
jgi:cytochrome c553